MVRGTSRFRHLAVTTFQSGRSNQEEDLIKNR